MKVYFKDSKLQKICSSMRAMEKAYGKVLAVKLAQRLEELSAVDSLADMSHLPPARCHELIGNRKGQYSVDLAQPYRLLFEPADDPIPVTLDGGIDRAKVREVFILEVADTH